MAFADDPGWTTELRALRDEPASAAVLDGLVAVLTRWRSGWRTRPVAVVVMPSLQFGRLNRSLADHIGGVGKLPVIDVLGSSGPSVAPDAPSGAKVSALTAGLMLRSGVDVPKGPVLLVDALYRSGWSMTVAASLLREAGATAVLPLVLHQLP